MLRISAEIFDRFPGALVGTVVARGIDNRGDNPQLTERLRTAEALARERLAGVALVEHPRIAPWRQAYREFGAKPKKYPSSIEALARRVLKGDALPSISPLVDLYNEVSLRHLLPVGGEDLDKLSGPLELRFADAGEPAVELLGRSEPAAPEPGEVIYTDDVGAVCRRWNWREAARTCLTAGTENAILVVEALPPAMREDLAAAIAALASAVAATCGAACETTIHG